MSKTRKILVVLVSCIIAVTLTACSRDENKRQSWLPFGLQFGQSYDSFVETIESYDLEAPALKPADSNNGYLTDHLYLQSDKAELYLSYEVYPTDDADTCSFCFSFNQDKELYEWYWMSTAELRNSDDVIKNMISTYNKKFGFDGTVNNGSNVYAEWDTESLAAQIILSESSDGSDEVDLIFHNFTYDLNS